MASLSCVVPNHSTLLGRLRAETRVHHDAIETIIILPRTLAEYRRQLEKYWGFIGPLERQLAATLGSDSHLLRGRAKTQLLEADLRSLGPGLAVDTLSQCSHLPSCSSAAECLGILYVLEGSTLGGQMIATHLAATFGLDVPCRYYRSYGPEVMRKWSEFKNLLTDAANPGQYDLMVQSAQQAFVTLQAWFIALPKNS